MDFFITRQNARHFCSDTYRNFRQIHHLIANGQSDIELRGARMVSTRIEKHSSVAQLAAESFTKYMKYAGEMHCDPAEGFSLIYGTLSHAIAHAPATAHEMVDHLLEMTPQHLSLEHHQEFREGAQMLRDHPDSPAAKSLFAKLEAGLSATLNQRDDPPQTRLEALVAFTERAKRPVNTLKWQPNSRINP